VNGGFVLLEWPILRDVENMRLCGHGLMQRLLLISLALMGAMGCSRYVGATALTPAADGSTWVYVQTSKDRVTGVYHCAPPSAAGGEARCTRVVLD